MTIALQRNRRRLAKKTAAGPSKASGTNDSNVEDGDEQQFKWTDDEIQLLLEVVRNYKAIQTQQKLDWVKIRSRYEQIAAQFKEEYPEQPSDLYPHKREEITRDRVTAKLKKIQTAYKKAEDSKRKSGGGHVVMTFYSICSEIWGGRPSIESLSDGFESSSVNEGTHKGSANGAGDDDDDEVQEDPFIDSCICEGISDSPSSSFSTTNSGQHGTDEAEGLSDKDTEENIDNVERGDETVKSRRELIDKTLKEYEDKRLARKRGRGDYESEMLGIARGESNLRNKMFVHMEKMGKMHIEKMSKLTTIMETLSNSIAAGFSMLRQLLQPPLQQPNYAHPWQPSSNTCQQNTPPPQRQQTYGQSHTFAISAKFNWYKAAKVDK